MMNIKMYGKGNGYEKFQSRNKSRPYKEMERTVELKKQDSNPSIARIVCNSSDLIATTSLYSIPDGQRHVLRR